MVAEPTTARLIMSLIFDGFKTREQAEQFAMVTEKQFNLETHVATDREDSMNYDIFPFELRGIIVHVERPSDFASDAEYEAAWKVEFEVIKSVGKFGGEWAGT